MILANKKCPQCSHDFREGMTVSFESEGRVSRLHFTSGHSFYTKEKCTDCGEDVQIHWKLEKIGKV